MIDARDLADMVHVIGHDGERRGAQGPERRRVADADHGTYPFRETELGYPHGDPEAHSLTANLPNQLRADIIRSHSDHPCAELAHPQLGHPAP